MQTNFGGTAVEILMFKPDFENEVNLVGELMAEISERNRVVAKLYESLSKLFEGDLQKIAGLANATDLHKRLVASKSLLGQANEEIDKLKKLMAECREAQGRALMAMPDYSMYASNGREDTIPGRTYFAAGKESGVTALPTPKEIPAAASLAEVALARRFST